MIRGVLLLAVLGAVVVAGCSVDPASDETVGVAEGAVGANCINDIDCNDGNACTSDVCRRGKCLNANVAAGTPCDDGNACTQADVCRAGTCAGKAIKCQAPDSCHDAGVCNPATGACSSTPKPDGAACTDANACTIGETCNAGVCGGGAPVACIDRTVTARLVARWAADGSAKDETRAHNGKLVSGGYAAGIAGSAFDFNGSTDYVQVPDATSFDFGEGDFSVTYWVNARSWTDQHAAMIHKDAYDGASWKGWLFNTCDSCGGIGFLTRDSATGGYTECRWPLSNFATDRWYHIAGVRQSHVLHLYVDGVERATTPEAINTNVDNRIALRIGSLSPASPQFIDGLMDDARVYSRALSASEIADVMSTAGRSAGGPIARWDGEGDASDPAGGNAGSLEGDTTFAPGVAGQAFSFDGDGDFVSVPDAAPFHFGTGDFSVSFWSNFDLLEDSNDGIIHKDAYDGQTWKGWLFNVCDSCGGVGFLTRDLSTGAYTECRVPRAQFETHRWYHIAGTRRSNVLRLYVDGALKATCAENVPTDVTNSIDLRIGSLSPASPQYFNGLVDRAEVWPRGLSNQEVKALSVCVPSVCQ